MEHGILGAKKSRKEPSTMGFKERIYQARKAKGLSQEDLAEVVGVSRQAVSKWETGEAMPDMEKLVALCHALELDMEYLALGKEPAPHAPEIKKPRKWLAILLAVVCFVSGILIGYCWRFKTAEESNPLELIEISDVAVTPLKEGISPITEFEIAIYPSQIPEGLAVAVLWGDLNYDPHVTLCMQDKDCYKVTLTGYYNFHYRISVLLTLDGEEKQIRILDVYGNETDFGYDYIS